MREYLKSAWRHAKKSPGFTLLNLTGLATGLTCALLIGCWIYNEFQINRNGKHASQLYQVLKNSQEPGGVITYSQTPGLLASTLKADYFNVENAVAFIPPSENRQGILSVGNKKISTAAAYTGPEFIEMFDYHLLHGNKNACLTNRNEILISKELALKLFPSVNEAGGSSIEWSQGTNSSLYIVAGVFEKLASSSLQFDAAFSYADYLSKTPKLENWSNGEPETFVLLKEGSTLNDFNKKIKPLLSEKTGKQTVDLFAQSFAGRYLHGQYENGRPSGGRITYVKLFALIGGFILLIACFNFMNLSTAAGLARMREAGLRKIIGAARGQLIIQYLVNALLLVFVALITAIVLSLILLPAFNNISGKQMRFPADPFFWGLAIAITILTGLVSGSYPAFYLTRFKPASVVSGRFARSVWEPLVRKGLMIFQFSLSGILLVAVLIVYRQMKMVGTKNLGYEPSHLVYFPVPAAGNVNQYANTSFAEELKKMNGVTGAAFFRHSIVNRDGGTTDLSWPGKGASEKIAFTDIAIGYQFIETAGIKCCREEVMIQLSAQMLLQSS